jgi:hypothetical protein
MTTAAPNPHRAAWLKTLHQWHWVSSALSLLGLLLFAITGITLNHASQIEARPAVTNLQATVPPAVLTELRAVAQAEPSKNTPLPTATLRWVRQQWSLDLSERGVEWSADEAYVPLPRPGGDAWLRIGLADGAAEYEVTDRGWISWANDLHKGRHTGAAWAWFIDIFAAACLLFAVTGLLILQMHAAKRPLTWPMVGLGLVVPALLALLFIH